MSTYHSLELSEEGASVKELPTSGWPEGVSVGGGLEGW